MSMKLLGETLDIHGGGLDLQFPHHENELAQSESFSGQKFARYWMHNGLLKMGSVKMAGSIGNVINIVDLLQQHSAETVRFLLLGTHYRSPIEYSEERLQEVRRSLESFYRFFERYQRITGRGFYELKAPAKHGPFDAGSPPGEFLNEVARLRATFLECMADDFNTGGAIGALYELLTTLNRFADTRQLEGTGKTTEAVAEFDRGALVLREVSQILGLFHQPQESGSGASDELVNGLMQFIIDMRAEARKSKNYAMADQIRQRLGQLGITLEDRAGGTGWRRG
jgi:cysteinyl-tRNA synthetase